MTDIDEQATVRRSRDDEQAWLVARLEESWGTVMVVSRGRLIDPSTLPALVAERAGERIGAATYAVRGDSCELVTINAFVEGRGAGTALLAAVCACAREEGCTRVWLVTTNDNLRALGFYQRVGMRLVAVHRDALTVSRRLKPGIPEIGLNGIPLRDELELELLLSGPAGP